MNFLTSQTMPLHPAAQQMIRKVEALSGRPVHVAEDAGLQVMPKGAKWSEIFQNC